MRYRMRPAVLLIGLLIAAATAGCDQAASDPSTRPEGPAGPARFSGGAASLGELAERIVAAIAAGDTAALRAYRVTEHEHNALLWPELPIAREDEHPFPVELAWENIEVRNAAGVRRLLGRLGDRPLRSAGVACSGEEERYPSFHVLRDCRVTVATPDARSRDLQLFRSVVVRDGRYKIIRYHQDPE